MTDASEREVAVFSAARRLPAEERTAYLDGACAGDAALRRRVDELLEASEEAGDFLHAPAPGAQRPAEAPIAPRPSEKTDTASDKVGERIGRYKLLQQIGEGGCGVVYMAEQEEPVRRRVALKIIKLGMDTKQVIARFEAERQALALMDHPNIAKVHDAGATETGRPYFVMELVRGVKITEYCDESNLTTQERLRLFVQVCHAIQHAHQKGVIHRDIKPSNILVTVNDGVAVPKVIDFGIAKATQGRLTDHTLFTAFEQFIGTPAYMSPEQAVMTSLDVDTRSDIYSMGVLLDQLLTGRTPFDSAELLASGLEEMRRTIREQEPPRPSTRLRTLIEGELSTMAKRRQIEPLKLVHLVCGDLDWIVMKCLEKDRGRRYETANGLAMDIQRHLNCEPVIACPPSRLYEFQKTVRRHKFGFAATAAVGAALLAGLAVSLWLLVKERTAHRRALAAEQAAESGRRAEAGLRQRAQSAEAAAREELWHSYVAQARAARFSGQHGRRFDSLEALAKAAAIRFEPQLRDEAIACLALPDLKLRRHIEVNQGVFDCALERYACVLTNTGQVSIRSASDDRELISLPLPAGAGTTLYPGKFSHNGKFLPVWYGDHSLRVWDLEHRVTVVAVTITRRSDSVDFQPDDGRLAVPGPGRAILYPLAPGQKETSFPTPFDASIVRFHPSGHQLAISSPQDHRVPIFDVDSGAVQLVLTNAEGLQEIAWHPRLPILATTGWQTGLVYLWDTATGRQIFALKGNSNIPGNVTFSQDGDIVISSGWDGAHLWHVRSGEHLMSYLIQGGLETVGPGDGAFGLSSYLGGSIELLSFSTGREVRRLRASEEDRSRKHLVFSPDGRWLAFAAGEVVELFDARTTELLATLATGLIHGLAFQRNSAGLLISGDDGLFRWPIRPGGSADELSIGPPESFGSPGASQQAALSENGQVFAAFQGDHVCVFDGETLRDTGRTGICGSAPQLRFISLSPDGSKLATGGWHDEVVRIWDARTGALLKELAEPEWNPIGSPYPVFEPNGLSLMIVAWSHYRRWETESWTAGPRVPRSGLTILALSPQSAMMAECDDPSVTIHLRDLASGERLATLQPPSPDHLDALAFSPDGTRLAVGFWGTRELMLWDLRLLREELKGMGMDWARPPYPPVSSEPAPKAVRLRVRTNSLPRAVPAD